MLLREFVVIPYVRTFPATLEQAYAWLTDYRDDDPQRTDRVVIERPVRERHPDRVVLDGVVEMLGRRRKGVSEVRFFPPDRWEAHIVEGAGRGSVYEYRLLPDPAGCRLEVKYRLRVRRPSTRLALLLLRRRIWRDLDRMWAGFAASMAKDLLQEGGLVEPPPKRAAWLAP